MLRNKREKRKNYSTGDGALRRLYPSWQRRHEAVLRLVVEHPRLTRAKIAAATGYSPWQLSRIINSPDFSERYERIRKIIEREITRRYVERMM